MAILGVGVRSIPSNIPDIVLALLTGLNAAALGLIALAAFNLSKSTITDKLTRLILFGSAAFGICYHAPWVGVPNFVDEYFLISYVLFGGARPVSFNVRCTQL
jgi:chromate transport protein ChrA